MNCPECKSNVVYANVTVCSLSWVNVNTGEIEDLPDYVELFDENELRESGERLCGKCGHKWDYKGRG